MEDNNYINIQGWMINRLSLKSNHLIVFAVIFGFSQDRESSFRGSLKYIQNILKVSRPTASEVLKELVEKKLITKKSETFNGVTFNYYKANFEFLDGFLSSKETLWVVKNFDKGSKDSLQGGSKESLHYNTNIYNTNDIEVRQQINSSKIDGSFTEDPEYLEKLKSNISKIKTYDTWKTGVCKKHSVNNIEDLNKWIDIYQDHVITQSKSDISINELRRHFDNWLGTRLKAGDKLPTPKEEYKPWKVDLSNMQFH